MSTAGQGRGWARWKRRLRRFAADRSGNVALIFGLSLLPTLFLAGMALDYASAIQRQQSLDAAADSAALAAVTPTMLNQPTSAAQAAAAQVFSGLSANIAGVSVAGSSATVTQNGLTRTAIVRYAANSANFFPTILGQVVWPIQGSATASATMPPNVDFYLLIDNSPSMALAATTAGINTMIAATPLQDGGLGCAFACHQSQPNSADTPGNPPGMDNYALAQFLGVRSRIQNVAAASNALAATAQQVAQTLGAAFRMAVYDFSSSNAGAVLNPVAALTSNLAAAGAAAAGVDVQIVCKGNYLDCATYDDSTDTDFAAAMNALNTQMPDPGDGVGSNRPQEVLFLVTDGVEDKQASACGYPLIVSGSVSRCIQPVDVTACATIKGRGIRIAILYTQYLAMPSEPFYVQTVQPFQSQIASNLQSCASPGLFFTVSTDDDVTAAMQTLFNAAVQTVEAHLSQ